MTRTFVCQVDGLPQPQGSKKLGMHGNRTFVLDDNDKTLRPWRKTVTTAVRRAMTGDQAAPFTGPVVLSVCFTLPRPKSAPKCRTYPDKRPDLSKLIRAVEDSMTDAGLWGDDAQVCVISAAKVYVGWSSGYVQALPTPGVTIRVDAP